MPLTLDNTHRLPGEPRSLYSPPPHRRPAADQPVAAEARAGALGQTVARHLTVLRSCGPRVSVDADVSADIGPSCARNRPEEATSNCAHQPSSSLFLSLLSLLLFSSSLLLLLSSSLPPSSSRSLAPGACRFPPTWRRCRASTKGRRASERRCGSPARIVPPGRQPDRATNPCFLSGVHAAPTRSPVERHLLSYPLVPRPALPQGFRSWPCAAASAHPYPHPDPQSPPAQRPEGHQP